MPAGELRVHDFGTPADLPLWRGIPAERWWLGAGELSVEFLVRESDLSLTVDLR